MSISKFTPFLPDIKIFVNFKLLGDLEIPTPGPVCVGNSSVRIHKSKQSMKLKLREYSSEVPKYVV